MRGCKLCFLHNLRNGKYFRGDTPAFIVRVIEYQERGLPHAHIVVRLKNAADTIKASFDEKVTAYESLSAAEKAEVSVPTMDDAAAEWVDDHISSERPIDPRLPEHQGRYAHLRENYVETSEYKDDLRLFMGIEKFHIHKHSGPNLVNGCLDKNGVCKKVFHEKRCSREDYLYKGRLSPVPPSKSSRLGCRSLQSSNNFRLGWSL